MLIGPARQSSTKGRVWWVVGGIAAAIFGAMACAVVVLGYAIVVSPPPPQREQDRLAEIVLRDKGPAVRSFDDQGASAFVFSLEPNEVDGFITPPIGFQAVEVRPDLYSGGLRQVAHYGGWTDRNCDIRVFRVDDLSQYPSSASEAVRKQEKVYVHVLFQCES